MNVKRKTTASQRDAKRAIVMNAGKKRPVSMMIAVAFAIAVTAGAGLFLISGKMTPTTPATATSTPPATVAEDRITYAASLFDDGQARHFEYTDADSHATISYFILKSTDGVIRAAFDACDVCWRAGKGYFQEGSAMVCRNCGRKFESVLVNEVQGGCNPAPLKRTIEGDQVVIHVEDLKKGSTYFNFSPKA